MLIPNEVLPFWGSLLAAIIALAGTLITFLWGLRDQQRIRSQQESKTIETVYVDGIDHLVTALRSENQTLRADLASAEEQLRSALGRITELESKLRSAITRISELETVVKTYRSEAEAEPSS